MSQAPFRARTALGLIAAIAVGALILASCGTATVKTQAHLSGTPALSISVPLSNVGCTLNDACVAVGTSSENTGPTAVGEFSSPKGNWFDLALPSTPSPLITSTACSGTQCLLAGSQPGGDLLWRFEATGHVLSAIAAPSGGIGIDALTCNGLNCALIDTSAQGGTTRFSESADGGTSWSAPIAMPWTQGDAITTLSCGTITGCLVGSLSSQHEFSLYATTDGGVTWAPDETPTSWATLSSLSCQRRNCVALASTAKGSKLVRSKNDGRTWSSLSLGEQASALACTASNCVVVGQRLSGKAWLASVHDGTTTNVTLRYVPSPLLNVACGTKVCAALGVTTLLSLPSPL
jgi:hypothetical protein